MREIFEKLDQLASNLRAGWESAIPPSSNPSIDKMMIWFTGNSAHTYSIRSKTIPVGYSYTLSVKRIIIGRGFGNRHLLKLHHLLIKRM